MGNSFLVCKKEKSVESLKDLEGKKIAAYGQNTAPDIVLKAALEAKGVDVTKIEFVYENSVQDVLTNRLIADSTVDYVLCAEPVISKIEISLKAKVGEISKIDLQNELNDELSLIPQAGIFVNKEYSWVRPAKVSRCQAPFLLLPQQLSWLEHVTVNHGVRGSSP